MFTSVSACAATLTQAKLRENELLECRRKRTRFGAAVCSKSKLCWSKPIAISSENATLEKPSTFLRAEFRADCGLRVPAAADIPRYLSIPWATGAVARL